MKLRNWPISSYDADFTDGQVETPVPIPTAKGGATVLTVDVTGADVWVQLAESSTLLGLATNPHTKAVRVSKDWVFPFEITLQESGRNTRITYLMFKPVAGAAGHITVNFFR